jgi:pyruvate dehydrogenase E2 component (dihydrolipoamide acetyltransferase)
MESGKLVEWLVKPGDEVHRGDIVAVVETQKGAIEIETFQPGIVEQILVDLGATVPVGTVLAMIAAPGEPRHTAALECPPTRPSAVLTPLPQALKPAASLPLPASSRVRASPAARRAASAVGTDLSKIKGTGPSGAILLADVVGGPTPVPASQTRAKGLDLAAMRTAIAAAMSHSKRDIPHYYLQPEVDASAAMQWLAEVNAPRSPEDRLLFGVVVLKAVACAVQKHAGFNGHYVDGRWRPAKEVHVGVAIAIRGGGLAAPALHSVEELPLADLMTKLRNLVERTRIGRLRSSELADATITVSSLGERGVGVLYGVIYPPQVALVGVGKVTQKPWAVDGAIAVRPVVTLTLAADHRVSDGHAGALFLSEIGRMLQHPETL